jgi:phosphoadenosine phosphosulfate reductase
MEGTSGSIFTAAELAEARRALETAGAREVVAWAGRRFGGGAAIASSFGVEDVVLIDLAAGAAPHLPVFTLDTGRLPPETYQVMEEVRRRYRISIQAYVPERAAVEELEREKGFFSFRRSVEERKECCAIRKLEPLKRALAGRSAWLTGLRREQSVTRAGVEVLEIDGAHGGILKLNPLAAWTEAQVWEYAREHALPVNALHARGYPSIGCAPCTRAVAPGEDVRAGRWWWESPEHKECGLHPRPARQAAARAQEER